MDSESLTPRLTPVVFRNLRSRARHPPEAAREVRGGDPLCLHMLSCGRTVWVRHLLASAWGNQQHNSIRVAQEYS